MASLEGLDSVEKNYRQENKAALVDTDFPCSQGVPDFFQQDYESSQKVLELEKTGGLEGDDSENESPRNGVLSHLGKPSSVPASFQLLSRAALRWLNSGAEAKQSRSLAQATKSNCGSHLAKTFEPWDFSDVVCSVNSTALAFDNGTMKPERPARSGVSGTYFLKQNTSSQNVLGVFKPSDEEPCVENSKTMNSSSSQRGSWLSAVYSCHYSGQGALKEVAAYLLDHGVFCAVPQTVLASCDIDLGGGYGSDKGSNLYGQDSLETKTGAFQVYVPNVGDAEDYGPGVFSVDAVQRIAFFDLRVLNCDRHGGNLLVTKSTNGNSFQLVPIDHGFILPDKFQSYPWPVWMDWPQVKEPVCEDVRRYAETLDGEMDARLILDETDGRLSRNSLRILRIMTALLQRAISKNLTLYEVGCLVYVHDPEREESEFSTIMLEAAEATEARNSHILYDEEHLPSSCTPSQFHSCYSDCGDPIFSLDCDGLSESAAGSVGSDLVFSASAPGSPSTVRHFSHWDLTEDDYLVRYAMKLFEEKLDELVLRRQNKSSNSGCPRIFRSRSTPDIYRWRPVSVIHSSELKDGIEGRQSVTSGAVFRVAETNKEMFKVEGATSGLPQKQGSRASPCSTMENMINNNDWTSSAGNTSFERQSV
ncbi:Phosphatidylinositol 4-kinase gamma 4 [Galdieria sulphuraria]|nr:Phosphatidylinositol 4-kinase gamma 4 [Galdieria sulphuraria]